MNPPPHHLFTFIVSVMTSWVPVANIQQIQYSQQWNFFKSKTFMCIYIYTFLALYISFYSIMISITTLPFQRRIKIIGIPKMPDDSILKYLMIFQINTTYSQRKHDYNYYAANPTQKQNDFAHFLISHCVKETRVCCMLYSVLNI